MIALLLALQAAVIPPAGMRIPVCLLLLLLVGCAAHEKRPEIPPAPLTAIAITYCSEIVAIYITSADGHLMRIDKDSGIPDGEALTAAQLAVDARRLEIGCNGDSASEGALR